jgi:hypothetical protein
VLPLAQSGKILSGDRAGKPEFLCQTALPFTRNFATLRPIVLLPGGEFLLVVTLRLAR